MILVAYTFSLNLMKPNEVQEAGDDVLFNGLGLVIHTAWISATVYFGDSTTKTAQTGTEILGRFMSTKHFSDKEKLNLMFVMSQLRSRNVCIQNTLFKINWSVLLTVSGR
jgi:hypothetical protein